ncbi:hypothetical protein EBI01_18220 [Marinomonas rhizomae]|nr:hypothetical protein EBI01_18220 [Marinomonas rhizomae]
MTKCPLGKNHLVQLYLPCCLIRADALRDETGASKGKTKERLYGKYCVYWVLTMPVLVKGDTALFKRSDLAQSV